MLAGFLGANSRAVAAESGRHTAHGADTAHDESADFAGEVFCFFGAGFIVAKEIAACTAVDRDCAELAMDGKDAATDLKIRDVGCHHAAEADFKFLDARGQVLGEDVI